VTAWHEQSIGADRNIRCVEWTPTLTPAATADAPRPEVAGDCGTSAKDAATSFSRAVLHVRFCASSGTLPDTKHGVQALSASVHPDEADAMCEHGLRLYLAVHVQHVWLCLKFN